MTVWVNALCCRVSATAQGPRLKEAESELSRREGRQKTRYAMTRQKKKQKKQKKKKKEKKPEKTRNFKRDSDSRTDHRHCSPIHHQAGINTKKHLQHTDRLVETRRAELPDLGRPSHGSIWEAVARTTRERPGPCHPMDRVTPTDLLQQRCSERPLQGDKRFHRQTADHRCVGRAAWYRPGDGHQREEEEDEDEGKEREKTLLENP